MFSFIKPKANNNLKTETVKLSGLHCTSCAINIDMTLEELSGVSSKTNYQKQESKITYDPSKTNLESIKKSITDLGYKIV